MTSHQPSPLEERELEQINLLDLSPEERSKA